MPYCPPASISLPRRHRNHKMQQMRYYRRSSAKAMSLPPARSDNTSGAQSNVRQFTPDQFGSSNLSVETAPAFDAMGQRMQSQIYMLENYHHIAWRGAMTGKTRRGELIGFIERVLARNPELGEHYAKRLAGEGRAEGLESVEASAADLPGLVASSSNAALEAIVSEERPVLFIEKNGLNFTDVAVIGVEAQQLVALSKEHRAIAESLLSRVGRIDLVDFPGGAPFGGTGWLIDAGIVVTNRHVADAFARQQGRAFVFRQGSNGGPIGAAWDTGHLRDKSVTGLRRKIAEVLYIEQADGPNDIAFLKLESTGPGDELP